MDALAFPSMGFAAGAVRPTAVVHEGAGEYISCAVRHGRELIEDRAAAVNEGIGERADVGTIRNVVDNVVGIGHMVSTHRRPGRPCSTAPFSWGWSPVGIGNRDSNHAARPWYSWMRPPSRSRRRTSRGLTWIAPPAAAIGEARPRARCGRPRL